MITDFDKTLDLAKKLHDVCAQSGLSWGYQYRALHIVQNFGEPEVDTRPASGPGGDVIPGILAGGAGEAGST